MPIEAVSPRKISNAVKEGFDRIKTYRAGRAMFIKDYVGQYYKAISGITSAEPINLIFAALRILIPNIIMKNPVNKVTTSFLAHKDYAELLSLSLNAVQERLKLKKILRGGLVDSCFGLGIFKTSICESGELYDFEDMELDNGQLYTALVDLDDFVFDSTCTKLRSSTFLGHRVRLPRQQLLDTDGWDHDLIAQLPLAFFQGRGRIEELTQKNMGNLHMKELQNYIHVIELYVPKANAIVHIPDPYQIITDRYLKIDDYYGPVNGGYTFLSLTPPIPNNPLPVAPVGIWRDLHVMANKIFHKLMNQADRQKDVIFYSPEMADVVQAAIDAKSDTIEAIACANPDKIKPFSFGGQNPDNERMLIQLQTWFNYIAGNPDQLGGLRSEVGTATQAEILQANATVSVQDMRDTTDEAAKEISENQAWFLHNDPMIEQPLVKRASGNREVQLWLTPEQRQGDFLEFTFDIVKRSMTVLDPVVRAKRIVDFMTNVVPAGVNATLMCMRMGTPFNLQRYLTKAAEELGIGDWLADIFDDPEFQQKLNIMMQMGPQNQGKATMAGVMQNKGFPGKRSISTPGQEINQGRQEVAGIAQATRRIV